MAVIHPIPVELLRQLIRLDAEAGKLYWLPRWPALFSGVGRTADWSCNAWNSRYAGKEALTAPGDDGYLRGSILGKNYLAHRVIFALFYGVWPEADCDHEDTDKSNNRPDNLRNATRRQNLCNRDGNLNSTSQYKGVCWTVSRKCWVAQGNYNGKNRFLGYFSSEEEAARAYDAFASEHHGEFVRLNFPNEHPKGLGPHLA
jgi:hypothetical protein